MLAQKNSRYDMYPESSISPKHRPISLSQGKSIEIVPFDEVRLCNTSEQCILVKIDALATEAGEVIMLDIPRDGTPKFVDRSITNGGRRMYAYIVGTLQDEKDKDLEGEYEED